MVSGNMSWKKVHDSFYAKTYAARARYYAPFLKLLDSMGVTPNMITNARLLFVIPIGYYFFYSQNLWMTTLWYSLFWIVDTVDGSLARYKKTESDRGKFYDVVIDNFVYSFVIIGVMFLNIGSAPLLAYHLIIQLFVYVLAVVKKHEGEKSDFIIKPQAETFYHKFVVHVILLLYVIFGFNMVDVGMLVMNIWLTLEAAHYYIKIQEKK